jgi:tRNA(Ile)-lysidine synthase
LHVQHGLSANADAWQRNGEERCRRWGRSGKSVEFVALRLTTRPGRGESVEAWARRARYEALAKMAVDRGVDLVLLAHHRRDQAETFLLQALRAGGVAALSAMPAQVRRAGVTWARPWLDRPREAIEAYLRRHRLRCIDDDTNADPRFARNRLRQRVWPALLEAFPDAETALASSATWAQEAASVLDECAAFDLRAIVRDGMLDIAEWRRLSPARRGNALRSWLRGRTGKPAPASLVERLVAEVLERGARRWPLSEGELRSYRGWLHHSPAASAAPAAATVPADLRRVGVHAFPDWGGSIVVVPVDDGGVPLDVAAQLELRGRRGGDRFQAGAGRPPRSLKLQYQSAGIPEWQRAGPIVAHRGVPVFVPGLGIDARHVAAAGATQLSFVWRPD